MTPENRGIFDYLRLDDERPFLLKAFDRLLSDEDFVAYAQLVEQKDPERAEWLRLGRALHSRATDDPAVRARFVGLANVVGFDYANVFFHELVLNCGHSDAKQQGPRVRFAFQCPKRWETLAPTESDSVRFCQHCQERVYYCNTIADASSRAKAGECIAVPKEIANGVASRDVLGRPDPVGDWAWRLFGK